MEEFIIDENQMLDALTNEVNWLKQQHSQLNV